MPLRKRIAFDRARGEKQRQHAKPQKRESQPRHVINRDFGILISATISNSMSVMLPHRMTLLPRPRLKVRREKKHRKEKGLCLS
jgi:hypothetical protein